MVLLVVHYLIITLNVLHEGNTSSQYFRSSNLLHTKALYVISFAPYVS